jgi:hypothetical protein
VDWRGIAGFRNVAVHDYLGIDTNQVWHIVEHDLPELKPKIEALLASSSPTRVSSARDESGRRSVWHPSKPSALPSEALSPSLTDP